MNCIFKRLFITVIVLTILSIPYSLQAQKNAKTGILWRISGNGTTAPSYLFGTMHLKDKKLFNFPDSLYKALEQTDGFAMEVDPDSLVHAALTREDTSPLLHKVLKPADFNKIKKKLEKEFKIKPEEVTVEDLESYCKSRYFRIEAENSMNTFMDAYLYSAAARMGKWTGAVEDISDQDRKKDPAPPESTAEEFLQRDTEIRTRLDSMISVYLRGNADLMAWISSGDTNMIVRNKKMVQKMDSLINVRTMTFAVGAAHLTGQDGLVDLLRSKGYTVELVNFTKKIFVLDYPFTFKELPWVDIKDPNGLYTVQMPGAPIKDLMISGTQVAMNIYSDIRSGISYFVFAMQGKTGFSLDSAKSQFLKKIDPDLEIKQDKVVYKDGIEGKDFTATSVRSVVRVQLFDYNDVVYAAYLTHAPNALVATPDIEKFFGSFNIKKPSDEFLAGNKIYTFESKTGGFRADFPSKPTSRRQESSDGVLMQHMSVDIKNQVGYIIMVNVLGDDLVFKDDSVQLAAYLDNVKNNTEAELVSVKPDTINGFPANWVEYTMQVEKLNVTYKTLNVIRGRRNYFFIVYAEQVENNKKFGDPFFKSISLFTPEPANWKEQTVPNESFTVYAPELVHYEPDSSATPTPKNKWLVNDSLSAVSMVILKKVHAPFLEISSDTSYLRAALEEYMGEENETLDFEFKKNAGFPSAEIKFKYLKGHTHQRLRCVLNGEALIYLFASGEKAAIESAEVSKFLNSFNPGGNTDLSALYKSKADTLLKLLASPDSVISGYEMREALESVKFTKHELPALYEALKRKYRPDFEYIPKTIASVILNIRDTSSISSLHKMFLEAAPDDADLKFTILNFLANWKTAQTHQLATQLLMADKAPKTQLFGFMFRFYDSAELARPHFHELMPLLKDSITVHPALNFAHKLIRDTLMKPSELLPYKSILINLAKRVAATNMKNEETATYYYYDLCALLATFRDPAAITALKTMLTNPDTEVKMAVVNNLIALKQPLPAADLVKIAADKMNRIYLYDTLVGAKKLSLFPKQYLTQKALAESQLCDLIASDEDIVLKSLVFVGERIVTYKKKKQKVFLFKVTYDGDEPESYLGIVGPYPLPPAIKLKTDGELMDVMYTAPFDATKIDAQLKEYIKRIESNEEEEKE